MEQHTAGQSQPPQTPPICSVCHQPVQEQYYFCPNCGNSLKAKPLPVTPDAQVALYLHSIILPMILFITVSKWRGIRYYTSPDPQAKTMGIIAWVLIVVSTLATIWFAIISTQKAMQQVSSALDASLGGSGYLQ